MQKLTQIQDVMNIYNAIRRESVKASQLAWTQYTSNFDFGIQEQHQKTVALYQDEKSYQTIRNALKRDLTPTNRRRVSLLEKAFRHYHLSDELTQLGLKIQKKTTELAALLNRFRPTFNGETISSVEITKILEENPDRALRKQAYLARTQINKPLVDAGFLELVAMRNEYAHLYSNQDFVDYSLTESELDATIFAQWKEQVQEILPKRKQYYATLSERYNHNQKVENWDIPYIHNQLFPFGSHRVDMLNFKTPVKQLFAKFGFDLDQYNITYDLFSRANKSEWGYHFTIDHGKDSRILANVQNEFSYFNVLLHETGHGIHAFNTDPNDPLLNMGISGTISEGIANLFGAFRLEKEFYQPFFKKDQYSDLDQQIEAYREMRRVTSLDAVPRIIFDQQLYRTNLNSLNDINALRKQMDWDYLELEPNEEEPIWGDTIHHTTHPIYLHNYLMGDVTCEILKSTFCQKFGVQSVFEKPLDFGTFLKEEVIQPSGMYPYAELIKRFSGKEFSLTYLMNS